MDVTAPYAYMIHSWVLQQPSLCHCCPRRGHCHCDSHCHLRCHCQLLCCCPCCCPLPITISVGHCRCSCPRPLLPPSLLRCHQPLPSPLPSPSAIALSITVSHHSCHLCQPSPSPSLLAISKSCCLGIARIVFKQFEQRMLTLFILFGQWAVH
jgi:hypothetical protein